VRVTGPDTPYDAGTERTSVLDAPVTAVLAEALDTLVALDPVPGLAPLVRWAAAGEGVSLVHRLPLGARTLAQVRAEGPLRLGAAAAIGRSLVGPLRALHDAGLAHGAVGADTVVLIDAGLAHGAVGADTVVLTDAGLAHGSVSADTVVLTDAGLAHARRSAVPGVADDGRSRDAAPTSTGTAPTSTGTQPATPDGVPTSTGTAPASAPAQPASTGTVPTSTGTQPATPDGVPTSTAGVPASGAVLAATGAGWVIPPGAVGGPDPAGDVAALAELVRHLVGVTPLPSGLVLVLLRCADEDPAMRPTLDDLDRALAACLLTIDEDSPGRRASPEPVARAARPFTVPVGSVLDRPRVLRPHDGRPRRGRTVARGRRRLALLAAAVVSALVLGRAVVAPALADVAAAPEQLASSSAPTTAATTAPAVTSTPAATPAPAHEGSVGSGGANPSDAAPVGDPVPGPPLAPPSSRPGAREPLTTTPPTTPTPTATPTTPSGIDGPAPREPARAGESSQRAAASSPTAGRTPAVPAPVDWATVLTRLDDVRHAALVAGSREALARAVDPDGPAWAADAALADRVRSLGARLVGGQISVVSADLVSLDGRGVRLSVVDARAAYAVTLDGSTARVPARGVMTWDVRLTRAADGTWRIHDVRAPT
jgi:hypothetical protein